MRRVRSSPYPPRPRARDDGSGKSSLLPTRRRIRPSSPLAPIPPRRTRALAAALLLRLLQVGLGLRELGPRAAVGELEQLAIVAARGGRVSGGGCGSRRAGIAAQPVLGAAQRRFEGR